ncbi:MAG: superoxide dismutase, Ni [Dehalococcoidia bacterium]|nr:superoxide dismutase, Ni [Chloroflexi bacterium CFX7]MCL4230591.1 superoxide dismutase, Ni [Dehalococcoidia bacterium]NUQ54767.1 superoxide dismutase, Ni [Dehalococcoidia bacterium]
MSLLSRILRPTRVAYAHCDGPCGVYDPASARIAAEAVLSMTKKALALQGDDPAMWNSFTRFATIKEQQAEIVKRELDILWHDYFKPEHLEKHPGLHETFWKAAKLASKCKQEMNVDACNELLKAIESIHGIFWATKGRDVPFYIANPA